jgi:hypothetical protein
MRLLIDANSQNLENPDKNQLIDFILASVTYNTHETSETQKNVSFAM